jgi:hypothetical protein
MPASAMSKMIGKTVQLDIGGMTFLVKIVDARSRWGKTDYLVTPKSGHGQTWKSEDSIRTN